MKKIVFRILLTVFVLAFAVSGFFVARQLLATRRAASEFGEVSALMRDRVAAAEAVQRGQAAGRGEGGDAEAAGAPDADNAAPAPGKAAPDTEAVAAGDPRLVAIRGLHEEYTDFVGWISISGTVVDYPVMHTPRYPEFYLDRNFVREKSGHGTPFLDAKCDPLRPSDNMIIYAHHMKDGSMFACLEEYKDAAYCEAHSVIEFCTMQNAGRYEVIAAFLGSGDTSREGAFAYNQYIDFGDEGRFDEFIGEVMGRRLYDTGVEPRYGDRFLMLSTCEYSTANNRMVVVAREIDD